MTEEILNNPSSTDDKFKLWTRWFWVGIIVAAYHAIAGLVFGLVLVFEKGRRKEGIIIIIFSIFWFAFSLYFLTPWIYNYTNGY